MNYSRKWLKIIIVLFLFTNISLAQHTFSIVAVDTETGEIGSAGASCVDNAANIGGVIIISGIIPGRGAINGQATICIPHVNLNNAINQMQFGASPDEIIDFLYNNDACQFGNKETRQYGVVDFDMDGLPRSAAFTGTQALSYAGHRIGENYAIQGNILLGPEILDSMEAMFLATEGPLAKKLMAAMQGANVPGADSRCLDEGTSSKSAYLTVARPDDTSGNFYLEINVMETPDGTEPLDSLQTLFDVWCDTLSSVDEIETDKSTVANVFPNPSSGSFKMQWLQPIEGNLDAIIYNVKGEVLKKQSIKSVIENIDLESIETNQLILLMVKNKNGVVLFQEKILLLRE